MMTRIFLTITRALCGVVASLADERPSILFLLAEEPAQSSGVASLEKRLDAWRQATGDPTLQAAAR